MNDTTRCRVCNRPLRNPVHASAGIGPVCADKLGLEFRRPAKVRKTRQRVKATPRTQLVVAPPLPFEMVGSSLDITIGDDE